MNKLIFGLLFFFTNLALAGTDPSNTFRLGDGNPSLDKKIIINQGTAPYPTLKWNAASSTLQFSNDGVTFSDLGSGSGSGQGFNVLVNPDFESGVVQGWTNSGGTFASVTAGSNLLLGKGSATFTASGSGQFVASSAYLVPNGLLGRACAVSMLYKGGSSNLNLEVFDGTLVIATQALVASSTPIPIAIPFKCPDAGTIQLRVKSIGASALIAMDQMFLGENVLFQVNQANYVGGVTVPAGCDLSNTGSPGHTDFVASSCTGSTIYGSVTSFAESGNGQVNMNSLPPGEYFVVWQGQYQTSVATTNSDILMTDGTTEGTQVNLYHSTGTLSIAPATITAHFKYTTAGDRFFKLQGAGSVTHGLLMNGGEAISIYRYPSTSEVAVRPDVAYWEASLKFNAANPTLSTSTVSDQEVTNANLTATNYGTITAQVPCSGTNPSTGLTCSAGDEGYGIVFNAPRAGKVEVCADFAHTWQPSGGAGALYTTFKIVETTNSTQSIIATSQNIQTDGHSGSVNIQQLTPVHVCGQFQLASTGLHTFRLFYSNVASGAAFTASSLNLDSNPGSAASNATFKVRTIDQLMPAPVLVGSVLSDYTGVLKVKAFTLDGSGNLLYNYGNISATTHPGTGHFTATFGTPFLAVPVCTGNGHDNGGAILSVHIESSTTSGVDYHVANSTVPVDIPTSLHCIGPQ